MSGLSNTTPARVDRRLRTMRQTMALVAAAALAVGFVAGLLAAVANRPSPSFSEAGCQTVVAHANRSLVHAHRVKQALADHTRVMTDLVAGASTPAQARRAGRASLVAGAAAADRFDLAVADYLQALDRCHLEAT